MSAILEQNGLTPVWDRSFSFGYGFHEQIENYIAHAHVFIPVITAESNKRGWVHQEIGYAKALHVPISDVRWARRYNNGVQNNDYRCQRQLEERRVLETHARAAYADM